MKENEHKKLVVRVTEGSPNETTDIPQEGTQKKIEKLKKPLIFILMGVVFLGCIYLIFKPSKDKKAGNIVGLNEAVPQATGAAMPDDKGKAYEQEMQEKNDQEKRNALATLSDYWNTDSTQHSEAETPDEKNSNTNGVSSNTVGNGNPALNSYRNAQSTLGSFYQNDNSETIELRRQLNDLKEQLAEKDVTKPVTVNDQLALMEKSYQMAAKYLPTATNTSQPANKESADRTSSAANKQKEYFMAFTPTRKNTVSALYREPTDSAFLDNWSRTKNRGFYTAGVPEQVVHLKNSIKACVYETQTVVGETGVRLRLLEAAQTPNRTIPKGTIVTANAKYQGGRLQLKVTSIELGGNIILVDITIYDMDGQQGLYVPDSPERNAVTDIVANMGNATGSSFSMSSSTGQQIASDLSKSAVQGISGYFAKKIRTPRVTLKSGYQVFLVSKK